jgi:hypothetical protein
VDADQTPIVVAATMAVKTTTTLRIVGLPSSRCA